MKINTDKIKKGLLITLVFIICIAIVQAAVIFTVDGDATITGDLFVDIKTLWVDSANNRIEMQQKADNTYSLIERNLAGNAVMLMGTAADGSFYQAMYNGTGAEKIRLNAKNNQNNFINNGGNFGLGTTTPNTKLDIIGELEISDTNTGGNAGTDLCIDANNRICKCGQCA